MRVIDCHCHIYPQKIAHKAVEAIGDFYHIPMQMDGTIDTLLKEGGLAGVTDFLVHSVATTPQVKRRKRVCRKEVSLFRINIGLARCIRKVRILREISRSHRPGPERRKAASDFGNSHRRRVL
ncbi:MAG: hypothetical protein ACLVKR_02460 [Lachnospiraceae bacterium]